MAERVFLGWDRPALPAAADWLLGRFPDGLGEVLVATPGARAWRRLLELLVERSARGLVPPRLTTAERVSDELLALDGRLASHPQRSWLWAETLRAAPAAELPFDVAPDAASRLRQAQELQALHAALAAEDLDFADALAAAPAEGVDRWRRLTALQRSYRARLHAAGFLDPHDARRAALAAGRLVPDERPIVLVGVVETSRLAERVLAAVEARVTALVVAPEALAEAFDGWGRVRPPAWKDRDIELDDARWRIAPGPEGQAVEVERALVAWSGRFAPDEITLGVPDEQVAPYVERRLLGQGLAARPAADEPLERTPPVRLLERLADLLATRSFAEAAALARHGDLAGLVSDAEIEALDEHATRRLPQRWDGERPAGLARLLRPLLDERPRPLAEWAAALRDVLTEVYGEMPLDGLRAAALRQLGQALAELAAFDSPASSAEAVAAFALLLPAESVPPPPAPDAIELLGWLELPLDDAPALVLTGCNAGVLPEPVRTSPWIDDALAAALDLPGEAERRARDAWALSVVARGGRELVLVSGRHRRDGEPLSPSPLLFHADDATCCERMRRFVSGIRPESPVVLGAAERRRLPRRPPRAMESVRVTDFRAFLRSPYGWYLQRHHGLGSVDDARYELDEPAFGSLLHRVLEDFGRDEAARDARGESAIGDALEEALARRVAQGLADPPQPAVRLQVEQARRRLAAFARWQARRRAQGWRILAVEWKEEGGVMLPVPDEVPVRLVGTIDRIERHDDGRWAILDYKTSDLAKEPKQEHGPKRDGSWQDLQLPLYVRLAEPFARRHGLAGAPLLGYVALPRDPAATGERLADWDEATLGAAVECAGRVVSRMRREDVDELGDFDLRDPVLSAIAGFGLPVAPGEDEEHEA